MDNAAAKALPQRLLDFIRDAYRPDDDPIYFAGGHEWSDGTVYSYNKDKKPRLLKILMISGADQLAATRERLDFIDFLATNGIDTIYPVHSANNKLVEFCDCDNGYILFSWDKAPGEHIRGLDPVDLASFYSNWGKLIGSIHRLTQSYPRYLQSACQDSTGQALISFDSEWRYFDGLMRDEKMREAWRIQRQEMEKILPHRGNYGFIHNDPHPENILRDQERLVLIDFDVANYHWFLTDIAICIYSEYSRCNFHSSYAHRSPDLPELFLKPFLRACFRENDLNPMDLDQIELFLNYHRFLMYCVFYDQINSSNPQYLIKFADEICSFKPYLPSGLRLASLIS